MFLIVYGLLFLLITINVINLPIQLFRGIFEWGLINRFFQNVKHYIIWYICFITRISDLISYDLWYIKTHSIVFYSLPHPLLIDPVGFFQQVGVKLRTETQWGLIETHDFFGWGFEFNCLRVRKFSDLIYFIIFGGDKVWRIIFHRGRYFGPNYS